MEEAVTEVELVKHFIALVDGWNARGWGEYLLWEVVEGLRDRPFRILDPLPAEDLEVCRQLRDVVGWWPCWTEHGWDLAPVDRWRAHARQHPADDIRDSLARNA